MTAMELNAQIWRDMAEIADSESLLHQLAKYLKALKYVFFFDPEVPLYGLSLLKKSETCTKIYIFKVHYYL